MSKGFRWLVVWVAVAWLAGGCTTLQQPTSPPAPAQGQLPSVAEFERLNLEVERLREQLWQLASLADEAKRFMAERQFFALCHEVAQAFLAWRGAAATAQELLGTDAYPATLEDVGQKWETLRGASDRLTEIRGLLGGRLCPASEPAPILAPVPVSAPAPVPDFAPAPRRDSGRQ